MVWIFALGIIGFCIVSAGFRKLVIGLLGAVACVAIAVLVYGKCQDYAQRQEDVKTASAEANWPACAGKDQTMAWLKAGGKCRKSGTLPFSFAPSAWITPTTQTGEDRHRALRMTYTIHFAEYPLDSGNSASKITTIGV